MFGGRALWVVVGVVSLLAGRSIPPLSQAADRILLVGTVLNGVSNRGVSGATVRLRGLGGDAGVQLTAVTGDQGQFKFDVKEGAAEVVLSASADGYLDGYPWQGTPTDVFAAGTVLYLQRGDNTKGVVIRLWPEAAISGSITDQFGNPYTGAVVGVLTHLYTGEGLRWWQVNARIQRTDDRGAFRVSHLTPGRYVLAVRPRPEPGVNAEQPAVFFADASSATQATPIEVGPGDDRSISVSLPTGVEVGAVVGTLNGEPAQIANREIYVVRSDLEDASRWDGLAARTDDQGRFVMTNLRPGSYRVSACVFQPVAQSFGFSGDFQREIRFAPPVGAVKVLQPPGSTLIAATNAVVEADKNTSISLTLRSAARIHGRLQVDVSPPPSPEQLNRVPVLVRPADGRDIGMIPLTTVSSDGSFVTSGLPPGRYVLNIVPGFGGTPTWFPVSLRVGTREVLGEAIEIGDADIHDVVLSLTDKRTQIAGNVQNGEGRPAVGSRVVVFPQDPQQRRDYLAYPSPRRVVMAVVNGDGGFAVNVLPGKYLVAVRNGLPDNWMSPDFLQTLMPRAVPVDVAMSERQVVVLRDGSRD